MEKLQMICINCPLGCALTVEKEEGSIVSVTGNTCPRGKKYAETECLAPVRTLTTTVRVAGKDFVSVKSREPIPKGMLADCMREIAKVTLHAPVKIGDVVIKNILHTGVDIVATKNIDA